MITLLDVEHICMLSYILFCSKICCVLCMLCNRMIFLLFVSFVVQSRGGGEIRVSALYSNSSKTKPLKLKLQMTDSEIFF